MKALAVVALLITVTCDGIGPSPSATPIRAPSTSPTAVALAPLIADVPPPSSERVAGGCGKSDIYKGGRLPDWATVNAPKLEYVVATPGIAVGYIFNYPMSAGLNANTKVLWYVG